MKILSIDSSTSAGSILLTQDENLLGEINLDSAQTHSSRLLVGVDYLLTNLAMKLADLEAYAVISGPGSFTGIRVGLTIVKGLADTNAKPTIPITAFEAWAGKFPTQQGLIVPVIDARRGDIYAAVFERSGEQLRQLDQGMVDKPAQILARLDYPEILFVGNGLAQCRDLILDGNRPHWRIATSDPFLGRSMARIAYQRARLDQFTTAQDLQAYYLRKSDAELFWKEK